MQQMDINWTTLGLSLAAAFVFGVLFAVVVRWSSRKKLAGQTAWAVVIGVTFTLLSMIPVFGLNQVALMFLFFATSGISMIIEYLLRIQKEMQQDEENAKGLAKDLLK